MNLTNSCARGKASRDSCLDVAVLVQTDVIPAEKAALERRWQEFYGQKAVFKTLMEVGKYSEVHLDLIDGNFAPLPREWTAGPDAFEVEIGNYLVYSAPLWKNGDYLDRLKAKWLPYYGEDLRRERLQMVRRYCLNNLDHIPLYVDRGLYFQSFDRFYNAFREFLQALFISRRIYPLTYDKWIREQIEEFLDMPELYPQLLGLFEIESFESQALAYKARTLRGLVDGYAVA